VEACQARHKVSEVGHKVGNYLEIEGLVISKTLRDNEELLRILVGRVGVEPTAR
jgi:hypothetical protein